MKLEVRGNRSFLMLKPDAPYEAVFDTDDRRDVNEIGLSLEGQEDALKRLVGQKVTAAGTLQLEPVSPYYFNGTLILAQSVRLADGSTLLPRKVTPPTLPKEVRQFSVLVTFTPRARNRFSYQAWDEFGHPLPTASAYLSCGLNGPGDVMNFYCPAGYKFDGTGGIENGRFTKTANPEEGFDFAQFGIDDPVRHFVQEAVECTKKAEASH